MRQEVWAYLTSSISDPVAFINKRSGTVSRVVVFTVTGVQGVYDRFNLMFAIQVQIILIVSSSYVLCYYVSVTARSQRMLWRNCWR